jgi:hypothetical protein
VKTNECEEMFWVFHSTGVHCFNVECNTALNVLVYYTLPGVRVIHSSQILNTVSIAEEATGPQLCSKRDEQDLRRLNLLSRYPRGSVVKVLVCHPIVKGSILTLAMIFHHGSHPNAFLSPVRDERENRIIYSINKSFPVLNVRKIKFKNGVKSI